MLRNHHCVEVCVDLGAPGRENAAGEDDAGEDFFDRGVRDSGKKMEAGDGHPKQQRPKPGRKASPVAV